jgi:GTP-binding protein
MTNQATPMRGPVVAIDGPAGAGKSTLAKRLADMVGLPYVNTGLMYRAVAAQALAEGVDLEDGAGLGRLAAAIGFELGRPEGGRGAAGEGVDSGGAASGRPASAELLVRRAPRRPALASPAVEATVSLVARHAEVRAVLREVQRDLGGGGAVMEGRDIGTVVFPDAEVKIFLSADPSVRAGRRRRERGGGVDVATAIVRRDALDAATNPLTPAPDAHVIDATELGREAVFREALRVVRATLPDLVPPGSEGTEGSGLARVAVVGRQNVGKSTLVNRLIGRREAIAHEMPGVTRDRIELPVRWGSRSMLIVDTGGFKVRPDGMEARVAEQAARAMRTADLILLVVDAQTGVQQEDADLAAALRTRQEPVLVVANKVDSDAQEPLAAEFHALGLGDPVAVSALHGRGSGDLLDRILDLIPEAQGHSPLLEVEMRFALVGRPNVGKSSLFNRLVRDQRAVVHEEAGTTRDAIDSVIRVDGRALRFVDTAGFRPAIRTRGVEYYGLVRSMRAIDRSHVTLLVVDAAQGLTGEDKRVAARVAESGRGLVAALNKWDLVPSEERAGRFEDLVAQLGLFPGTPVVKSSALTGSGVTRLLPALLTVHAAWSRRVPTSEVNRVLQAAVGSNPPPRAAGRIRYGTQVSAGPPSFVLFGTGDPGPTYRRFLENSLRGAFGFDGVPVRLSFRIRPPRYAARARKGSVSRASGRRGGPGG